MIEIDGLTTEEILAWKDAKENLDKYKKLEMKLRKALVTKIIGIDIIDKFDDLVQIKDTSEIEGSNLPNVTAKIKANQGTNTSIDLDEFNLLDPDELSPEEKAVVVDKPTLDKKALTALRESNSKSKVLSCVEDKPSAPTLAIELSYDD